MNQGARNLLFRRFLFALLLLTTYSAHAQDLKVYISADMEVLLESLA